MIFTIKQLEERAKSRPQGYYKDIMDAATKVSEESYMIPDEKLKELLVKYRLPNYAEKIKNLANAAKDAIASGLDVRSPEEIERVLSICATCPFLIEQEFRCGSCGCYLEYKTKLKAWVCPVGKW